MTSLAYSANGIALTFFNIKICEKYSELFLIRKLHICDCPCCSLHFATLLWKNIENWHFGELFWENRQIRQISHFSRLVKLSGLLPISSRLIVLFRLYQAREANYCTSWGKKIEKSGEFSDFSKFAIFILIISKKCLFHPKTTIPEIFTSCLLENQHKYDFLSCF